MKCGILKVYLEKLRIDDEVSSEKFMCKYQIKNNLKNLFKLS